MQNRSESTLRDQRSEAKQHELGVAQFVPMKESREHEADGSTCEGRCDQCRFGNARAPGIGAQLVPPHEEVGDDAGPHERGNGSVWSEAPMDRRERSAEVQQHNASADQDVSSFSEACVGRCRAFH